MDTPKKSVHAYLQAKRLGIQTYKESVVYLSEECPVCKSEGFRSQARVLVTVNEQSIIATLNMVTDPQLLDCGEAGFSEHAWALLNAEEGDRVYITHPRPLTSLSFIRKKIYGGELTKTEIKAIIDDVVAARFSDIHISSFLTACAGGRLSQEEIVQLTHAMIKVGHVLRWDHKLVVDKHCVGGLPGNRTTPIVVPIVAAFGLLMPKTSSRAITSPAGTADTLSVLTRVELSSDEIHQVVDKVGGCMVWGGSVGLSPADDILIRVERALSLDSEGQMIASVMSKKVAAGASHVLVDIPIGETAKVRSREKAEEFKRAFEGIGQALDVKIRVFFSDGSQPVGRGIGPALEARDVLSVLKCEESAPQDLRHKALEIAGMLLEFQKDIKPRTGYAIAQEILDSGQAYEKFKAICEAQGGLFEVPEAEFTQPYLAKESGVVKVIDNRALARIAALAGAPSSLVAGIDMHVRLGDVVQMGQPLFTVHAGTQGELDYAFNSLYIRNHVIEIDESEA